MRWSGGGEGAEFDPPAQGGLAEQQPGERGDAVQGREDHRVRRSQAPPAPLAMLEDQSRPTDERPQRCHQHQGALRPNPSWAENAGIQGEAVGGCRRVSE